MAATRESRYFPDAYDPIRAVSASELWLDSAARTTSDNSGVLGTDYNRFCALVAQVDATVVSGTDTPGLTVSLEDSVDGTNWNGVTSWTEITAVGREIIRVNLTTPFAPLLRVSWAITGTDPSFTFSVRAFLRGI